MDGAGKLSSVLTGHLGQPARLMSVSGVRLWQAEMDPFGRFHTVQGGTPSPDLHLPGQWAEPGSGLYQNWHRDYDPTLGRYLQADPIGLSGGQSLYGYAYQNPMRYVDPEGLRAGGWGGAGLAIGGVAVALANALCDSLDDGSGSSLGRLLVRASGQVAIDHATDPPNWIPGIGPLRNFGGPLGRTLPGGAKGTPPRPRGGGPDGIGPDRGPNWNDFWKNESGNLGGSFRWKFGGGKSSTKWTNQMSKRGWTTNQIDEAISTGTQYPAANNLRPGNGATRFVHPGTGRSVVRDNVTHEIIHIGGDGFKYGK